MNVAVVTSLKNPYTVLCGIDTTVYELKCKASAKNLQIEGTDLFVKPVKSVCVFALCNGYSSNNQSNIQ